MSRMQAVRWVRPRPRLAYPVRAASTQVDGAADISHATFISSAPPSAEFDASTEPIGRLSPTKSHLFKLILPLQRNSRPTAFLLHPSQPLSHLSRLITGSLPPAQRDTEITFLAVTGQESDIDEHLGKAEEAGPHLDERRSGRGRFQEVSWSQSTDLSDFIKQSCLHERFKIVIGDEVVEVVIPSFASRTEVLRKRLLEVTRELERVTKQKKEIDVSAHRTAQRLGTAALGVGVVYWAGVVRWTFFTDAGWDMMEPFTWTVGFGSLLGATGFLIYHNREVSYSSLLDLSVTARQKSLYDKHGLDIEQWTEMVSEAKTLRREIKRIAQDYDIEWKGELENLEGYQRSADLDKTIDEASEMAEQTKEKADKARDAERKGRESSDAESEKRGRERAERAAKA